MDPTAQHDDNWRLITEYNVEKYKCGLHAGNRVRLIKDLDITRGKKLLYIRPKGQIWTVLAGSEDDPGTIWFLRPDGERHTWPDEQSVFEYFEVVD